MSCVKDMHCALCERYHISPRLKEGWFAREYRCGKKTDTAKRLICPDCLKKILHFEINEDGVS